MLKSQNHEVTQPHSIYAYLNFPFLAGLLLINIYYESQKTCCLTLIQQRGSVSIPYKIFQVYTDFAGSLLSPGTFNVM